MQAVPRIKGLYHFAYPCRDAEETRAFYEDVLGLPLVHCMQVDSVPSTGEAGPYAHIFFEMGDGSYIAAFDRRNGEQRWRTPREEMDGYATPLLYQPKSAPPTPVT